MLRAAVIFLALVPAAWAQAVISAHSGMVNFVEGEVQIAGQPVKLDGAIFPDVKIGQTLSTQVEILSGSALIEASEILKNNRIAVKMGDAETSLLKTGLYHFNADAGQVRAFEGKAQVSGASSSTELKGGRTLLVGSSLTPDKFNKNKSKDELYTWSQERDYRLALANISAARSMNTKTFRSSLWAFDPWLGMYTFLPYSGRINNPFGISWYSPATVWIVFRPAPTSDFGYSGGNSGWQGASPSSASASVAPSSNASTGAVGVSSGSSSGAVAASAGASRGR
jgi:hypothetical protein